MNPLPIFLKLEARNALLIGAGNVALEKIGALLPTGPNLRVIAPEALPEVHQLARESKLQLILRPFQPSDLDGQFIAIAATNDPAINQLVHQLCMERNIPSNSVDDIPNCDFFFGSIVTRGPLQIAISTSGESPAVAQRLRREIDAQLPADIGPWLENLGELRRQILATHPRTEGRKLLLHQLAQLPLCESESCPSRQLASAEGPSVPKSLSPSVPSSLSPSVPSSLSPSVPSSPSPLVPKSLSPFVPSSLRPSVPPTVALVGAGPGDPDLLTLKAMRLIQSAQVILHDDLVPSAILQLAPPHAVVHNVGKRCGAKTITQDEINALMVAHARAHRRVVRLKSGDPLFFGRAAEEIAALTEAGIPFEIVPGITAASAAAAALGCSLTDRDAASNVTFSTGHHAQSHNHAPLPEIEDTTRVVYMPGRDLTLLAAEWLSHGLPPDFPCAVVSHAAQPTQRVRYTTLANLGNLLPAAAPSLLIAGWAIRENAVSGKLAGVSLKSIP